MIHWGKTLLHGRRSFVYVRSLHEAEMLGLFWVTQSMANMKLDRIVFKASFEKAREVMLNPSIETLFPELRKGHTKEYG